MANRLGILVSSDYYLDKVISLTTAAHQIGKKVEIFFSHTGVFLTQKPEFEQLVGKAKMALCLYCFEKYGLEGDVPGIEEKDFATQARHAEMIKECDRYLVF